ncbi:CRISPR-associated endonuclease Cas1 [Nanobdella aerobiophila]|uniref:CRISPR-associated endonuclease Cas1 n=1 Tax=Nanobdella aerobiophila TaxID=2586965 RepID=A0A915WT07_9ARCH|nr:type I-B CRISPR-associated endonuclease Cas1b [Nanobdella aerobiophila]BBL45732.1 CRISPR-associated endonuclease Cas1 [Nanobdella aerobiophila]
MSKNIYIISIGKLFRKYNNLYFIDKDKKKRAIPLENISNIFILNKVSITYNALKLIADRNIFLHFFYENREKGIFYHLGSFVPKHKNPAGIIHIKQALAYNDIQKRSEIALEIVDATRYNMIKVLEKYSEIKDYVQRLRSYNVKEEFKRNFNDWKNSINIILGIESNIWQIFYDALDKVLKTYKLEKRTRRPPRNEANAIVSFSNMLLYSQVLSEIYKTHLDPTISFLHEPFERRFSLALDFAEPFKPIITFRILIWLINQDMIKSEHFVKGLDSILLNEYGRKLVIKEFDKRIDETIKIKGKGRKSIKTFIRKQCYNLERYLIEEYPFEAFRLRY